VDIFPCLNTSDSKNTEVLSPLNPIEKYIDIQELNKYIIIETKPVLQIDLIVSSGYLLTSIVLNNTISIIQQVAIYYGVGCHSYQESPVFIKKMSISFLHSSMDHRSIT
jgi:hypothetical protein